MDDVISIPEAANRLGVSETIVRRLVARGDLVPVRTEQLGKQTRRYFRASDVEAVRRARSGASQS